MGANMWEDDVERIVDNPWSTPSLALAAYLIYCGHTLVRVDLVPTTPNDEQAFWVFDHTAKLKEDVMAFSSGGSEVEPHQYYGFIQEARKEMLKQRRIDQAGNVA